MIFRFAAPGDSAAVGQINDYLMTGVVMTFSLKYARSQD